MKKVHLLCDEANTLGKMEQIAQALTIGRSFGLKLQLYYQDIGQLKKCWPDGADQTLLANTAMIAFGVNDVDTAKYIVERLGKTTVASRSGGTNWTESRQPGSNGVGTQRSCSWGGSDGWQETGRELLQVNEVMGLSERIALSFVPGLPPIWTTVVRYYEEGSEQRPGAFWPALRAFGEALCWLAAVGFFAVVLTGIVYQR